MISKLLTRNLTNGFLGISLTILGTFSTVSAQSLTVHSNQFTKIPPANKNVQATCAFGTTWTENGYFKQEVLEVLNLPIRGESIAYTSSPIALSGNDYAIRFFLHVNNEGFNSIHLDLVNANNGDAISQGVTHFNKASQVAQIGTTRYDIDNAGKKQTLLASCAFQLN